MMAKLWWLPAEMATKALPVPGRAHLPAITKVPLIGYLVGRRRFGIDFISLWYRLANPFTCHLPSAAATSKGKAPPERKSIRPTAH